MSRPNRRLADIPKGTVIELFTRNRDKSFRRKFRWNKKPVEGQLVVGERIGDAVVCSGIPLWEGMLIRC